MCVCGLTEKQKLLMPRRSQNVTILKDTYTWCDGYTVVQSTRNSGLIANLSHNPSHTESSPPPKALAVLCDAVNTQLWTYS